MASVNLINGLAKRMLAPEKIATTEKMLEVMHIQAIEAKDPVDALLVGQLLTEVQKVRAKQQAPAKAPKKQDD